MTYVFLRFIEKWLDDGRFPRDELKARWWVLGLGAIAVACVAAGLLIAGT
jgi:hypothetical protein